MAKKLLDDKAKVRLNMAKRASKIRAKVAKGAGAPEEREWLATYESTKKQSGRPLKSQAPAAETPLETAAQAEPSSNEVVGEDPSPPRPPRPEAPAPEPPPYVPPSHGAGGSGDWRAKYRGGAVGGREATCVEIAAVWVGLLKKASASVEKNGGRPVMTTDQIESAIAPACVLTVDKLLPADFEVGPEVTVAVGSSVILGQAWWTARKAKNSRKGNAVRSEPGERQEAADSSPAPSANSGGADTDSASVIAIRRTPQVELDAKAVF